MNHVSLCCMASAQLDLQLPSQDVTRYGGRLWPRPSCVRWGPSSPTERGTAAPYFSAHFSLAWSSISATAELLSFDLHFVVELESLSHSEQATSAVKAFVAPRYQHSIVTRRPRFGSDICISLLLSNSDYFCVSAVTSVVSHWAKIVQLTPKPVCVCVLPVAW